MNVQKKIKRAEEFLRSGQLDQAKKNLEGILEKIPQQFQANRLLGLIYFFKKDYAKAEKYLNLSLAAHFNEDAAKNLTVLLIQQKRWEEAYPFSQKLMVTQTNEINLILNHALVLRNIGQLDQSLEIYNNLLKKHSNNISIYITYGFTLNLAERFADAIEIYLKGMQIKQDDYALTYNLGITYLNQFDYPNALKYLKSALELNNQSLELWLTIAVCHSKRRDFKAAFESVSEAKKLAPNNPIIPFQMGTLYLQQGKDDEAMKYFKQVIKLESNHIEANYHIGLVHLRKEQYKEAAQYYQYRVIRQKNKFGKFNDFELPEINNDSNLTISWEQGVGDEILYLSLLNYIKDKVKSITYITSGKLLDWLKINLGNINVITDEVSKEYIQKNPQRTELNVASLLAYVDDWESFFNHLIKYSASESLRAGFEKKYKSNTEKIIGISWMSANKKIGDEKSIPLNEMSPILKKNKIISLQYGNVTKEIEKMNAIEDINILYDDELDYYNDINGLAALISICDVVVTCSNVTAHIAGRLGINTYLMVPKNFGNLWYWNETQEQSKWYPSITILRQKEDMNWSETIETVRKNLTKY